MPPSITSTALIGKFHTTLIRSQTQHKQCASLCDSGDAHHRLVYGGRGPTLFIWSAAEATASREGLSVFREGSRTVCRSLNSRGVSIASAKGLSPRC